MWPEVLPGIPTYPIALAAASTIGAMAAVIVARRDGVALRAVALAVVAGTLAAYGGAKAWRIFFEADGDATVGVFGGFRYAGGILGLMFALGAVSFSARRPIGRLADVFVIPAAVGIAIARLGCLASSCCHGVPTTLPIGIQFPPGSRPWGAHVESGLIWVRDRASQPVHPTQLYIAVWALVSAAIAYRLRDKLAPGGALLVFLTLHSGGRLVVDRLRADDSDSLFIGIAVVFALAASTLSIIQLRSVQPSAGAVSEGSNP